MAASATIHAFLQVFKPVLHTIFFPSNWLLYNLTIVQTTDSGEGGMNPVAMTITKPQKEYWPSRGSNRNLLFSSLQHYQLSCGARRSKNNLYPKQIETDDD